jgi:tetratricopeptide (TPR) repeat protein
MDTGVLHVVNGRLEATATYTENFPRALERIPPQIQNLLELRWDRILANARAEDRSPEALEWAVTAAYALSDLPAQGDGRIGVAQGTVQRLMNAGIFRQQENRAVFFHQSHFRFFRERNKTIEQQKAKQLLRYLDEEQEEGAFQQRFLLTYHADKLDDDAVEQTLAIIKAMGLGVKYGVEVCNNLIKHLDERSVELSGMALRGYDTAGDWLQRLVDLKTGANVYKAAETRLHKDKDAAMPGDVPMPETVDFYVRAINTSLSVGQDERALSFVQRALEVIRGDLGVAKIKYRRSAIEKELYKLDEAGTDCRAALAVFRRSRECALVVDALYDLSEIEFARKETMQAGEAALREGNDLAQQLEGAQALEKISRYPLGCAKTLMLSGRYDEAVHYAKKGAKSCLSKRDHFWGIRCRQFEVLVHLLHARVANEADRMEALQAAKEALHWAQDLFNATGMERSRAELPYLWGKYHIAIGAHEAAARDFSRACDQLNDQLRPPRGRPYQLHAAGNGDAPRVEWYEQFYLDMACSLGEIGLALETSVLNAIPSDRVIESVRDLIGSPQDRAEHWQQVSWEPYCLDVDPPYFIALRW